MKILVTGGAGYVGHFVTKKLLEAGHTVTVLDNLSYGNIGISPFMEHDRFSFVFGDIGNLKSMVKSVKGQDAVIALAAIVGDPACNLDEDETIKTNFLSTKILADVCDYYGVKRIVFASSCSVYGDTKDAIADENFQLNPLSLYARTRVMSEEILLDSNRNISPVILRLSTVFGASKRMRFDLVVNFLTAMAYKKGKFTVFGGNQWRPNLHVQDAADIFIQALFIADEALSKHRIYNVGMSSNNLTIDEMAEIAKRVVPNSLAEKNAEATDKRNYRVDFSRLKEVFNVTQFRSVEDGAREVLSMLERGVIHNFEDDIYYNAKYLYRDAK